MAGSGSFRFRLRNMPEANYSVGETFPLQFAWRLPGGDYVRAVFKAQVLDLVPSADKYVVRLAKLEAGRQEDPEGQIRPTDAWAKKYWALVGALVGRKITIAYETDSGQATHMRLETLTGEHNFFTRYEDAEVVARGIQAAAKRRAREAGKEDMTARREPDSGE